MPISDTPPLPTVSQLARAIGIALLVAAIILVTAVLPAEYGIDPTGIGQAAGLLRPPASAIDMTIPVTPEAAATVTRPDAAFRSDEMTLTLKPGEGVEIKATMVKGSSYVFSWTVAGGTVEFDMHGEYGDGTGGEASYAKGEEAASDHGTFHAPFDGRHGWFWQNLTWEPVTITLKTSGFYSKIEKL
ncbi:MAG: hypothetical protein Q8O42_11160 [Acidobacteriota bacterium]|nr:hypothetical protein [Acidobacteriota bacterium]